MPRLNDIVEDRSTYAGIGRISYLRGNEVRVRYNDGSEEALPMELLVTYDERHWII